MKLSATSGNGIFIQTGGTHTITGDLALAASPGSRGTLALLGGSLSVGGNYTQTAAGTLAVGFSSSANFPKIEVGGTASLNGAFIPVLQGGYLPLGNQLFHGVITAAQGVNGTFGTMANQFITPTLFWQPLYTPNTFDLLVLRSYTNPALTLTRNQSNVGAMLNGVATSAAGDLNTGLNAIDGLSSGSLVANAFQQISPDKATALPTLAFAGANLQMRNLSRRITNLRFGGRKWTAREACPAPSTSTTPGPAGLMLAYNSSSLTGLITARKEAAPGDPLGPLSRPGPDPRVPEVLAEPDGL